ncbi:hypothetical protein ACFLZ1_05180 [Patescibacteria group bacterium]
MKSLIKLFLTFFVALLLFASSFYPVKAQEDVINVYFFWSKTCPHCADEKPFLENLEKKYSRLKINSFEISTSQENLALLQKVGNKLEVNVAGAPVPFTVVGEHYFIGWYDQNTTGAAIEEAIVCGINDTCPDIVGEIINETEKETKTKKNISIPEILKLPIFGEIHLKRLSLPVLTFAIALVDGFNPCAMWVLLFLISLLLGMKDRKKMWIFGITFILTSGLVYFIFMSAWLNLFLFLGYTFWVRIIIGLVALTAGILSLKDYFKNKDGGCEVVNSKKRKKVFEKLKDIIFNKKFGFALIGIILLAFAVNLVELVCSAGLPAIFTQILALNNLSPLKYYSYLVFYILIFMLDDLVVFMIAMLTLKAIGIEGKYSRLSRLIGGIVIFIIGILLLFKPEILMFG